MISAAAIPRMRPSLSVTHTVPSRAQETGPGTFFAAKAAPSRQATRVQILEPHRHLARACVLVAATTRSMMRAAHRGLAHHRAVGHCGRCVNR